MMITIMMEMIILGHIKAFLLAPLALASACCHDHHQDDLDNHDHHDHDHYNYDDDHE